MAGVAVVATSEATSAVARAETDAEGLFTLRVPRPGAWQLSATRLGWSPATAVVTVVGDEPAGPIVLTMEVTPLSVEGLTAAVESGCDGGRGSDALVETLGRLRAMMVPDVESRALAGTAFQVRAESYILEGGRFQGRGEVSGNAGIGWNRLDSPDTTWVQGTLPIVEPDPERAYVGFITPAIPLLPEISGWVYHPVLPGALLSDGFVDTHCLSMAKGAGGSESFAVDFRPKKGMPADWHGVDGSITVDPAAGTARIRYKYAAVPHGNELWDSPDSGNRRNFLDYRVAALGARFGGDVDLVKVEGIGWVVWKANWSWPRIMKASISTLRPGVPIPRSNADRVPDNDRMIRTMWIIWVIEERRVEILSMGVLGGEAPVRTR